MKPEEMVLEVMQAISVAPFEFKGNFDHLSRAGLFQFLLAPQGGIYIMIPDEERWRMPYFNAAYDIAHYEVVMALQKDVESLQWDANWAYNHDDWAEDGM